VIPPLERRGRGRSGNGHAARTAVRAVPGVHPAAADTTDDAGAASVGRAVIGAVGIADSAPPVSNLPLRAPLPTGSRSLLPSGGTRVASPDDRRRRESRALCTARRTHSRDGAAWTPGVSTLDSRWLSALPSVVTALRARSGGPVAGRPAAGHRARPRLLRPSGQAAWGCAAPAPQPHRRHRRHRHRNRQASASPQTAS
jgi:hypothetical protein